MEIMVESLVWVMQDFYYQPWLSYLGPLLEYLRSLFTVFRPPL